MAKPQKLHKSLQAECADMATLIKLAYGEVTVDTDCDHLISLLTLLKDHKKFQFDQLIDVAGVDYLTYGQYDWKTESATESGFSRAVEKREETAFEFDKPRFAVAYHLLSTEQNHRLRVKVFLNESNMVLPSVCALWKSANWFEREAYDLFGILFDGHPDLRRILTDYGFIGHPFRKDFPLSGHVEMRYDAKSKKVIYEPVDITPRTLVPKVIREDNRYLDSTKGDS